MAKTDLVFQTMGENSASELIELQLPIPFEKLFINNCQKKALLKTIFTAVKNYFSKNNIIGSSITIEKNFLKIIEIHWIDFVSSIQNIITSIVNVPIKLSTWRTRENLIVSF